ncbi:MAG: ATP-binding protein [Candidatus Sulfotelmatobacter sp.]
MNCHCEKHGIDYEYVTGKRLTSPQGYLEGWADCPKCQEEYRQRCFSRNVQTAHIPPRFVGKGFDSFVATTPAQRCVLEVARDYVDRFPEHKAAGRCLVFCGKVGTGKTLLASVIASTLILAERQVFYATAKELILWIRSAWLKDSEEDEGKILRRIQKFDLLILDEIGVRSGGDADVQVLTDVIDRRYREIRPTLVVSNYSMEDMGKFLDDRGVDRLKENGGKVAIFNWETHRPQSEA